MKTHEKPSNGVAVALWRLVRRWREWRQHRRIMKACGESRRRMNTYTREQREELHRRAMEIINTGRVEPPSNTP